MLKRFAIPAAAFGLHLALAAAASATGIPGDPAAAPACSVSGSVPAGGRTFTLKSSDCLPTTAAVRASEPDAGFIGRAITFLFGVPKPTQAPRPAASAATPSATAADPKPGRITCAVDVADRSHRRQSLGISVKSDTPVRVAGDFEVTVVGNGTQRFAQRVDEALDVAPGEDGLVVLAVTNVGKGAKVGGSVLTDRGERIECAAVR